MESKPQVVLSVDDNDVDGALLERAFKRTSIPARLYRVSEGPQAMAYLAGDGIYRDRDSYPLPDLVLLDLAMPKMSGVEVLKWIRQQSQVGRTKVLIFTSSEKPEDFKAASAIGADGYLLKPTKFDDLKKLVKQIHEEWLAKRKAVKPVPRKEDASADAEPSEAGKVDDEIEASKAGELVSAGVGALLQN
ncbi:MAG TPA: response regulator [Verrucomicrobiae bacterium]|nr:response regulator [Verrucomicrobiae bacterium]